MLKLLWRIQPWTVLFFFPSSSCEQVSDQLDIETMTMIFGTRLEIRLDISSHPSFMQLPWILPQLHQLKTWYILNPSFHETKLTNGSILQEYRHLVFSYSTAPTRQLVSIHYLCHSSPLTNKIVTSSSHWLGIQSHQRILSSGLSAPAWQSLIGYTIAAPAGTLLSILSERTS